MSIEWPRLLRGIFAVAMGVAAAYFGKGWIVGNKDAVSLIATVFSVLAGFLVAIMALVADEKVLTKKSAALAHFEAKNIRRRLTRHKLTFQLYLAVMLLCFIVTLKLNLPVSIGAFLERVLLGLSVFAFLTSFALPSQVMAEYLRKLKDLGH